MNSDCHNAVYVHLTHLMIHNSEFGKIVIKIGITIVVLILSVEQWSHETITSFCNIKVHRSDLKEESAGRRNGLMMYFFVQKAIKILDPLNVWQTKAGGSDWQLSTALLVRLMTGNLFWYDRIPLLSNKHQYSDS
jgi:hypothetical protein